LMSMSLGDLVCMEKTSDMQWKPGDRIVMFDQSKLHQLYDEGRMPETVWVDDDSSRLPDKNDGKYRYYRSDYSVGHVEGIGVVVRTSDVAAVVRLIYTSRDFRIGDFGRDFDDQMLIDQ